VGESASVSPDAVGYRASRREDSRGDIHVHESGSPRAERDNRRGVGKARAYVWCQLCILPPAEIIGNIKTGLPNVGLTTD